MSEPDLLERFHQCLRYQTARSWQKPFLAPGRFLANQMRKYGLTGPRAGEAWIAPSFHLPDFTLVRGEAVSEQIASYGIYEPELTEAFLWLVRAGQVVVDIGMHLGYYTTLFARLVGSEGEVHAFEPTPSTRQIAQRNTERFPQVTVHPFAVWSCARSIVLRDFGPRWMAFNSLAASKMPEATVEAKEIEVQTTTLDEFRRSLGQRVSLLKIDAESAEREILAGAQELLRLDEPVVSLEVGDCGGSRESGGLVRTLMEQGYAPWEFRAGRFRRHEPRAVYAYDNLIFAREAVELAVS